MVRTGSRDAAARLAVGVVCALGLALTGCGRSPGTSGALARQRPAAGATYTLLQMNLCLSGLAGCYGRTAYPAVLEEAVAWIRGARPDAVTVNEACRGDMARIARQTGYHLRFSTVIYRGRPLRCIDPGDRGVFGDAVLTEAAIEHTDTHAFRVQAGIERRRWLCVSTAVGVDVCTAHLSTRSSVEVAGNDGQCSELATLLAHRAATRTVIFGGDVNRRRPCAPSGFWIRTDSSARQAPGIQHAYGSGALRPASVQVLPARRTDHDVLLVRARLATRDPAG